MRTRSPSLKGDTPITFTVTANGTNYPSLESLVTLPAGTHTITVQADNFIGMDSCTFEVEVSDGQSPVIMVPLTITATNDAGFCSASVSFGDYVGGLITATDNCEIDRFEFSVGTTPVTVTVYDVNGNSTNGSFNLIVVAGEAPAITCPSAITAPADSPAARWWSSSTTSARRTIVTRPCWSARPRPARSFPWAPISSPARRRT